MKKKINGAECVEGDADNGLMAFMKHVVFVLKKDSNEKVIVKRDKKYGGDVKYGSYDELESDFISKKLHPMDLKVTVAKEINSLLAPIRKNHVKLKKLWDDAYL